VLSIFATANQYETTVRGAYLNCGSSNNVSLTLVPAKTGVAAGQFATQLQQGAQEYPSNILDFDISGPNADSTRWQTNLLFGANTTGCSYGFDPTTFITNSFTCPAKASNGPMRDGVYRVWVFNSWGYISDMAKLVRVVIGPDKAFNFWPPRTSGNLAQANEYVWNVFELTVTNGVIAINPINLISNVQPQ
jgi:hypothetical protein